MKREEIELSGQYRSRAARSGRGEILAPKTSLGFLRACLRYSIFYVFMVFFIVSPASADMFSLVSNSSGATAAQGLTSNGIAYSYFTVNDQQVGALSWRPNFRCNAIGLGLDFNLLMGNDRPADFQEMVLRYVEYDDGLRALRYGVLNNVTYGWGLVMENYSTVGVGPSQLNNKQTGVKGSYSYDGGSVQAMGTWSHVYAIRLTQNPQPWLKIGETVAGDQGMTVRDSGGIDRKHSAVSSYGVDVSSPMQFGGDLFAELAGLSNGSMGFQTGYKWGLDLFVANFSVLAAYRNLGDRYIPNYFGPEYESNPIDIASAEAFKGKSGYLGQMKLGIMQYLNAGVQYESYGPGNSSLSGLLSAEIDKFILGGYYSQPNFVDFRSTSFENGAIMGGRLGYKVNPVMTLITNYKQYYDSAQGKVIFDRNAEVVFSF